MAQVGHVLGNPQGCMLPQRHRILAAESTCCVCGNGPSYRSTCTACTQVVPTKKCFSTLRRAGMSSEELEEKWRRDLIFPCGTFVAMAVQVAACAAVLTYSMSRAVDRGAVGGCVAMAASCQTRPWRCGIRRWAAPRLLPALSQDAVWGQARADIMPKVVSS